MTITIKKISQLFNIFLTQKIYKDTVLNRIFVKKKNMTEVKLADCTEITSLEYMKLVNPIFKGQTRVDPATNKYWMTFESEGVMYKIEHTL